MAFGRLGSSFGRVGAWAGTGGGVSGPPNLMLSSEAINTAAWTVSNTTTPTATRLVETTANGGHSITQLTLITVVNGAPYCYWIEATAAECNALMLYGLSLGGGRGIGFNLTTGTQFAVDTVSNAGFLSSGTLDLGGGRWRCWIGMTSVATSGIPGLYMCSGTAFGYTGTAGRGVTLHRQQLNAGSTPTAYRAT